jgi:hypothetical protein
MLIVIASSYFVIISKKTNANAGAYNKFSDQLVKGKFSGMRQSSKHGSHSLTFTNALFKKWPKTVTCHQLLETGHIFLVLKDLFEIKIPKHYFAYQYASFTIYELGNT